MNTMTKPNRRPGFLFGPDRRIRLLWRALIFYVLADRVLQLALTPALGFVARVLHVSDELTAANAALWTNRDFIIALVCTAGFAWYEGRRVDSYGLPVEQALGRQTWEGMLVGVVMAGAVAVGMYLLGGMQIRGLETTGSIGLAEELLFRSYLLQTLWKSIGCWPGAIVIALAFTADHYFFKTGENMWDVITLM
ncbi:MAG: protease family protein [Gammaproteobacteria bacterium]|jgi:membrane protease YdiL (CAAX protease family)|nr:protease family protein [Gammaproteobacteria bacterium]